MSWFDGANENPKSTMYIVFYNKIRITDLTINCWVLFILDEMVKQNDALSKVKGEIKTKEGESQKITGKYSNTYIFVMENWLSVFSKFDLSKI